MNSRINLSSTIRFVCPYLIIEVINLSLLYVLTFFFFFGLKIWNSKALRMYLKIIMTKSDISARYIVKTMSITIRAKITYSKLAAVGPVPYIKLGHVSN